MKNHLICVMEAVEALLEEDYEPERDVYLCFGHNEEVVASESAGAKAIMNTLKSRGIHLDSVIDEGGAILPVNVKHVLKGNLAGVGIAEKGYADFSMSVRAKGGHSSQPPKHSAIGKIADVVKDVENHQFKSKLEPFVLKLFSNLGRRTTYPVRVVACNLWLLKPLAKFIMEQIPPTASLIRTTTGVTMAEGSPAANVLPQEASVTANFRMMPGTTTEDVEKHLRKVIKNKNVEIKCLKSKEASNSRPQIRDPLGLSRKSVSEPIPRLSSRPILLWAVPMPASMSLYAIIFIALLRSMCARSSFSAPMLPMSAARCGSRRRRIFLQEIHKNAYKRLMI